MTNEREQVSNLHRLIRSEVAGERRRADAYLFALRIIADGISPAVGYQLADLIKGTAEAMDNPDYEPTMEEQSEIDAKALHVLEVVNLLTKRVG